MQVQAVFLKLANGTFDEGISSGLSGLDEAQLHAGSPSPEEHRLGCQLGAIVEKQGFGQRPDRAEFIEIPSEASAGGRRVDDLTDTLAGRVVD